MSGRATRLFAALLGNKGLKVVALLLAVITWYAIREEISFEKDVTGIPVEVLVDEGWALLDLDPKEATVRFQGPEESVWNLNPDNVRIRVDVRGLGLEGTVREALGPRHVLTPGGVRVVDIQPAGIMLSVDRLDEATVPVRVNTTGELPTGFEVASVVCRPATVRLLGPRQRVEQVEAVYTAPVDLSGRFGSFDLSVPLEPPRQSWATRITPSIVTVEVEVVEHSDTRTYDSIPVRVVVGGGRRVEVTPLPASVRLVVAGRKERLDDLDPEAVFAYVDCEGLDAGGTYELPVQVHVPGSLTAESVEPLTVKATLSAP